MTNTGENKRKTELCVASAFKRIVKTEAPTQMREEGGASPYGSPWSCIPDRDLPSRCSNQTPFRKRATLLRLASAKMGAFSKKITTRELCRITLILYIGAARIVYNN